MLRMPTYIVIESGTDRVLGVTTAADPGFQPASKSRAFRAIQHRESCTRSEPIRDTETGSPMNSQGQFDDPMAWEMFGLDAIRHGRLVTVIARRSAR
jgi:hypothetical protein